MQYDKDLDPFLAIWAIFGKRKQFCRILRKNGGLPSSSIFGIFGRIWLLLAHLIKFGNFRQIWQRLAISEICHNEGAKF